VSSAQFNKAAGTALVLAQSRLVAVAKDRHARVMGRDPRPLSFTRIVDGRVGALETTVRAAGVITYIYFRPQIGFERDIKETIARLDEVARFALQTLRELSPVVSGDYRDGHKLFVNGYPVADVSRWKPGDEISITNFVDYSRIIEVGDGKNRVPNLVYDQATDIVTEKHGRDAKIEFTWRGITDGMQIAQDPSQRRGFGTRIAGRTRAHNKSPARYPTIVISPHPESGTARAARYAGNALAIAQGAAALHSVLQLGAPRTVSVPLLSAPNIIDHE